MDDIFENLGIFKIILHLFPLFVIAGLSINMCKIHYDNYFSSEQVKEEMQLNDSEKNNHAEQVAIAEQTNSEKGLYEIYNVDGIIRVSLILSILTGLCASICNYLWKKGQDQHENFCNTDYENSNKEPVPNKIDTLSVKIIQLLNEKFEVDSLTYGKYETVINMALAQYNKNVQEISSYKALKKEVSKSKKEKIQPKIDELKKKNDNLISNLEDLYISLSITEENDTDSKIQNLQKATEELKYYHL